MTIALGTEGMSRKNPSPDSIADGARLAFAIDASDLTRQQFAAALNIGEDTVSRLIAGKAPVLLANHFFRKRVCAALGCTMELLDGDENPLSKIARSGTALPLWLLIALGIAAAATSGFCLECWTRTPHAHSAQQTTTPAPGGSFDWVKLERHQRPPRIDPATGREQPIKRRG